MSWDLTKKLLFIFSLSLLTAYTAWLVKQSSVDEGFNKASSQEPDFFLKEVLAVEYDAEGRLHQQLQTPQVLHYAQNDTAILTTPLLISYSPDKEPWHISANQGESVHNGKKLVLWNNVILHQDAGKNNNDLTIKTSLLTILPGDNIAYTDKAVEFREPGVTVHSVGMKAYLKEKRIDLLSHAQGLYEPAKAAQP